MNRYRSGLNRQLLNVKVPSRKAREQRKQLAGKFLVLCMVVAVSLTATVLVTKLAARKMFYENDSYTLRHVQIDNLARMKESDILRIAQIHVGDNLFAMNLESVRTNLESIPHIKSAEVVRQLPDTLVIRLTERQPVARLGMWTGEVRNGVRIVEEYLVDEDAVVMGKRSTGTTEYPWLTGLAAQTQIREGVRLTGDEIAAACRLLKRLETSPVRSVSEVVRIDVSQKDTLFLSMADGGVVKFLPDYVDEHVERLEVIVNYGHQNEKILRTADLTVDRNVPVVFQP